MLLFVVPRLVRVFIPQASSRLSRGFEENEEFNKIVNIMDGVMNKMQIDRAACLQQAICTAVQTASKKVTERKATSWDKIIDGLASNKLFQHYTYGSSAYDAAMYGLMLDRNCSSKYEACNSGIQKIINMAQIFLSRLD
ncbi:hypothetical protein LSTR_LSTR002042 [Laodelphax striatellus]|uniref:Uncharacterized protein n=1 Tax=Laodelphax striatellus TaxID=195883 RepID=A0A482XIG3_LAOST|nr:hypothetical protein LSTR_LSTR002042 [Laodelphax striatellus]